MYLFYNQSDKNLHQVGAEFETINRHQLGDEFERQFFSIPWRHHIEIITKCKNVNEAKFYIKKTIENGWSRAVLLNFLKTNLYLTEGKSLSNFANTLPKPQSDLANQILKDPYSFDFITLTEGYRERDLENALTENITKLLLELGSGFAFMGRQVRLEANDEEIFIDLLFYHVKLRAYIVVELKTGRFESAFIGQLGYYISAVNHLLRAEHDNPTIGLLICGEKNHFKAQWALESSYATYRDFGLSTIPNYAQRVKKCFAIYRGD